MLPAKLRVGWPWPLLLVLAIGACHKKEAAPASGDQRFGATARITGVRLVDSVRAGDGSAIGVLRRVEVQLGGRRDTIPGVLTLDRPGVLGDTVVVGFAYNRDSLTGVFVYEPALRVVTRRSLLPAVRDFATSFATPTFAPDGQSFLYVAYDTGQDSLRPTLRRWPSLDVVAMGPAVGVEETNAAPYATAWHGRDTAVATFRFTGCPAPLVLRTTFVLSAESMRTDTLMDLGVGMRRWWPWRDSVPIPIPGTQVWLVASTDGPRLGPSFVVMVRSGSIVDYADSIADVDFRLEGLTCPGVTVSGPQDAYDAFLRSAVDTVWLPQFQIVAPRRREDYGSPPRVISYQWSVGDRVLRKSIAWNFRTRHFDVLAPSTE
jgi:hypothetical protein